MTHMLSVLHVNLLGSMRQHGNRLTAAVTVVDGSVILLGGGSASDDLDDGLHVCCVWKARKAFVRLFGMDRVRVESWILRGWVTG
jgi:hypothetical protein